MAAELTGDALTAARSHGAQEDALTDEQLREVGRERPAPRS